MSSFNTDTPAGQHGGNLSLIKDHYPNAPAPWIDLSTGINPYGYPLPATEPDWHYHLPDHWTLQKALHAAARYYGGEHCALASGMQPLITALAALRLKAYGASTVGVVSPSYSEHRRVWEKMGHHCHEVSNMADGAHDVVIVCNPNNPDGRVYDKRDILKLAERLMERHGWLIVDESFADLLPQRSVAGQVIDHPNLVVLRSCGKFFGVAGLRVSAAIASQQCVQWLHDMMGSWPIGNGACHMLPAMFEDNAWAEAMRLRLKQEAQEWRAQLAMYFSVAGYTDLFTLVETPHAAEWFHHLASQGVLVRQFDYNTRWLRFGLPDKRYIGRLAAALKAKL